MIRRALGPPPKAKHKSTYTKDTETQKPPVITYHRIKVFEKRILRKIFGPICDNNVINNRELYSIYTDPDIIKTIKISKLRWTGHIMRMPEENPVKKLTLLRPEGSRRAGRPKLIC